MAVGADVTFYSKPAALDPIYGDHPTSYKLFIRVRPSKMRTHGDHTGQTHEKMDDMGEMSKEKQP
jgi:hypothetical protein